MKTEKPFPINTATACPLKWSWSSLYLNKGISLSCHRASTSKLTLENFDNFHNTDEKIEARKKMLNGEWPSSDNNKYDTEYCGYCRKIEDNGGFSDRQYHLTNPAMIPPELESDPTALSVTPTILEVFFNNTCNLACNYCKEDLSSKIQKEEKQWGYFKKEDVEIVPKNNKSYKDFINPFWNWFEKNGHNLRRLHVLGGEPFYQPEMAQLIDIFDKNPNPNCELSVITNLSIHTEKLATNIEKIKKLLKDKKLKRFDLNCSIDCWGPQQEYVRLGLDLNLWEKNFQYVMKEKWLYINTLGVVSPLTIKTMPELFVKINSWKKERKIQHQVGGVIGPEWWKAEMFGRGFFTEDISKIINLMPENTEQETNLKKYMNGICQVIDSGERNERYIRNFMIYLKEKDRRRKTDYKTVFPWLIEFDKD